jgi:hypothetical protein
MTARILAARPGNLWRVAQNSAGRLSIASQACCATCVCQDCRQEPNLPRPSLRGDHVSRLWEPVGPGTDLLRRWDSGPFFRSFSSNGYGYSPQTIGKMVSLSHSARYDRPSPTGSQVQLRLTFVQSSTPEPANITQPQITADIPRACAPMAHDDGAPETGTRPAHPDSRNEFVGIAASDRLRSENIA